MLSRIQHLLERRRRTKSVRAAPPAAVVEQVREEPPPKPPCAFCGEGAEKAFRAFEQEFHICDACVGLPESSSFGSAGIGFDRLPKAGVCRTCGQSSDALCGEVCKQVCRSCAGAIYRKDRRSSTYVACSNCGCTKLAKFGMRVQLRDARLWGAYHFHDLGCPQCGDRFTYTESIRR